jgi:adenylate cyclase
MGIEIERKFLIDFSAFDKCDFDDSIEIRQGYIHNSKEKVVRVRVQNDKCYLTIKGKNNGASRPEFEYEIPKEDAEIMLDTMCINIIEKTRHIFSNFGDTWEIDEFHGDNEGLVVAEVEIPSEDYELQIPKWVTKEVTEEVKYYNNNIAINSYKDWK